jgi:signal transduction histidine kinase
MMLDRDRAADPSEPRRPKQIPVHHQLPPRSEGADAQPGGDRALAQVRSVIEGLPEPILLTDEWDRIQLTNPSADALFAGRPVRDREDLLSRFEPDVGSAAPDDQPAEVSVAAGIERLASGATLRLRRQPNRWFSIETFPLGRQEPRTSSGGHGSVFVLRDVTDTHDLRPERDAFLSIMSHELRTPITTIYAGSSVLARNAGLTPPASRSLALDISAEAAHLYDLVEDLIVIARLERRVLDPLDEPVLLQRILDVTARVATRRAPDITFIRDGDLDLPPVRGDATYLEQVARDLTLTAARFGGADRPVTLGLEHDEATDEVVFRVHDQGPQLSASDRARAFDLPDESAGGRLAGLGVGPFVARHLVESMGGRVWARNASGGGCEMAFALPADRE